MKKFRYLFLALFILLSCGGEKGQTEIKMKPFDHTYASYSAILEKYAVDGKVDYAGLQADREGIDPVVEAIAGADLSEATGEQKLAFYINAYNILTLRSIIDAYPVKSIRDINGVWDKTKWILAGKKATINDIEHEILRKEFSEPRIHVAVNCASIGCPHLQSRPYYPDSLEAQLTEASQNFAGSKEHNVFDKTAEKAEISSIFDWFGEDFIDKYFNKNRFGHLSKKENASLNFLMSHLPEERQKELEGISFEVSFADYDWALNEVK